MKTGFFILSTMIFAGCQNAHSDKSQVPEHQVNMEESNKAIVKKLFEAFNDHNADIYDELAHPQYRYHSPSVNPESLTRKEVKDLMISLFSAFPDGHYTVRDILAEGDKVVLWHVFQGTHQRNFQGFAATGKKVQISGIVIFRIEDGKILEVREEADILGFTKQLSAGSAQ